MSYGNVNLESGHERHHIVTRCIHEEESLRDVAVGAKFSQMISERPLQDGNLIPEGMVSYARSASGRGFGSLWGADALAEGEKNAEASAVLARDHSQQTAMHAAPSVRAENAASIACFGLEKPLEARREMRTADSIHRVSESRGAQSGSSFFRRQREALERNVSKSLRNVQKGMRMVKALLARIRKKQSQPVEKVPPVLEHGQEYLLDSYGKDGAYKQMPGGALLKSNMNKKA